MRIQHNITALNAANKLKANESTVAKNIQKLSSGYRINSAADDAAGLAVSEKMRKQINGLSQAEDNTKNGISLIQTAEGGLNETSAILQRMNTLAVESANGTYKDADRANLQMEINSLNTEIDRISTSTKFNEISLLDGTLGHNYTIADSTTPTLSASGVANVSVSGGTLTTSLAIDVTAATDAAISISLGTLPTGVTVSTSSAIAAANGTYTFKVNVGTNATVDDYNKYNGLEVTVTMGKKYDATTGATASVTATGSGSALTFQVGAENVDDQRASLSIGKMDSSTLKTSTINIGNQTGAQNAIDIISDAVASVSTTRASLGALQNELEHTANNLSTMSENLTSAESTIRDVDMTDEYVQFSKNQILAQAANSMLAQANAQPQNVLSLLKG